MLFRSNGCDSTAILVLTVSTVTPGAPTAVTQTLVSNVCGQRVYRYAVTAVANAVGYAWVLPTSVGGVSGVTVDSGDATRDRVIRLKYVSNAAAISTDSIKVRAWSGCGNSATKGFKLTNAALNVPAVPASITITPLVTNVCGNRTYRYTAPALPAGSATVAPATGWVWSFKGTLGDNATIDSGDVNSQKIVVHYTLNSASAAGDSVKLYYTSLCGNSPSKALKLSNAALNVPLAPTSITITAIAPSVCGAKVYRYAAPNLPLATTTAGAATGWVWSFTGTLGANASIDSGDVNSQKIVVRYTSNAASATGDSVRVLYTSDCGNSANKTAKLTNVVTGVPAAPTGITITPIQTNVCNVRRYRYAAPAVVPAATATLAAPTGWLWSFTGNLGGNAFIDSGDVNSKVITVTYTSNAAAATGDSVKLQYTSSCGNSLPAKAKLSNAALVTPTPATAPTIQTVSDICGDRRYRYRAPALLSATATAPATTGWLWSFTGTLGGNAVIDSGDATSQVIVVRFTVYTGAATGDSVRVAYTSDCGTSANKSTKLSNAAKTCATVNNLPVTKAVTTPAESMSVKVFPNPTTSNFNLQVNTSGKEEVTARVLDMQGKIGRAHV